MSTTQIAVEPEVKKTRKVRTPRPANELNTLEIQLSDLQAKEAKLIPKAAKADEIRDKAIAKAEAKADKVDTDLKAVRAEIAAKKLAIKAALDVKLAALDAAAEEAD